MAALNMRPYLRQNHRAAFEETLPSGMSSSHPISANIWRERVTDNTDNTTTTQQDTFKSTDNKEGPIIDMVPGTTAIELEEGIGKGPKDDKLAFHWNGV
jgi:hypothetical protein